MIVYLLVASGGALGSLTRFAIGKRIGQKAKHGIPIGTMLVNISGAILLGIVSSDWLSPNHYILFGDGFLGAYTTFSTFMCEGFVLFEYREYLNALIYIVGSLILGVFGYYLGFQLVS